MSTTTDSAPLQTTSFADMEHLPLRAQVTTYNSLPLTLVSGSFGHVDVEDVIAGRAPLIEAVFTSDGRFANPQLWHDGPDGHTDNWVYYERWTAAGMVAHGYVHAETRRLLQAG